MDRPPLRPTQLGVIEASAVAVGAGGVLLVVPPLLGATVLALVTSVFVTLRQPQARIAIALCGVMGFTVWQVRAGVDVDIWRLGMVAALGHHVLTRLTSQRSTRLRLPVELRALLAIAVLAFVVSPVTAGLSLFDADALYAAASIVRWAIVFGWYALLRRALSTPSRARMAAKVIVGGAAVLAAYAIVQAISLRLGRPVPYSFGSGRDVAISTLVGGLPRVGSLSKEPSDLAMFLTPAALALIVAIGSPTLRPLRRRHAVALGIVLLALLLTFSRMYFVFAAVGVLVVTPVCWAVLRLPRGLLTSNIRRVVAASVATLAVGAATGAVAPGTVGGVILSAWDAFDPATYQPAAMLAEELEMVRGSPAIGIGPGNASRVFVMDRGAQFGTASVSSTSWYLGTTAEVGIFGLLILLAFLRRRLRSLVRGIRDLRDGRDRAYATAMFVAFVMMLVAHVYEPGPSNLTFAYLAIAESLSRSMPAAPASASPRV